LGSQTGGKSAAIANTLIETTKPGGVDPRSWLAGILARIADHRINRIKELLPWNSRQPRSGRALIVPFLTPPDQKTGLQLSTLGGSGRGRTKDQWQAGHPEWKDMGSPKHALRNHFSRINRPLPLGPRSQQRRKILLPVCTRQARLPRRRGAEGRHGLHQRLNRQRFAISKAQSVRPAVHIDQPVIEHDPIRGIQPHHQIARGICPTDGEISKSDTGPKLDCINRCVRSTVLNHIRAIAATKNISILSSTAMAAVRPSAALLDIVALAAIKAVIVVFADFCRKRCCCGKAGCATSGR